MSGADYPDRVNGHTLFRQQEPFETIRASYQCTACGSTELKAENFNAYGCPGSELRGADPVDKTAVQAGRGDNE